MIIRRQLQNGLPKTGNAFVLDAAEERTALRGFTAWYTDNYPQSSLLSLRTPAGDPAYNLRLRVPVQNDSLVAGLEYISMEKLHSELFCLALENV